MFILIALSLLFGFVGYTKHRRIDNPLTIFSALWSGVFFLYALNLRGYFEISTHTWIVLLCQTLGFSFGCFFRDSVRISVKRKKQKVELFRPAVYVMCGITIASLFSEVFNIMGHLSSGLTYFDIAHRGLSNENAATGIKVFINIFFTFPTTMGISAITASELFGGKKCKPLVALNIIIVAMYALQHGGRNIVLNLVFSYLFAYINSNRHSKLTKKQKRWVVVLCVLGIVFAVVLSAARGIENLGLSLYHYFACCIPHLDQWIPQIQSSGEYTYGFTSLNGFISPVFILLRGIGLIRSTPELYQLANNYISAVEKVTSIGYGVSTNAFVSLSYAFYADGGVLFVLFGNAVFGYLCSNQYRKMRSRKDVKSTALYLLLIVTICMSFIRFQFCQYFYAMALVMINLIYRREKVKK